MASGWTAGNRKVRLPPCPFMPFPPILLFMRIIGKCAPAWIVASEMENNGRMDVLPGMPNKIRLLIIYFGSGTEMKRMASENR